MYMMLFLYDLGIKIYLIIIRCAALCGHQKAKMWLQGRRNIFSQLSEKISENDQVIWFHAASLGEFEQGRPLIEKIKHDFPAYKILLTFYSPSGYEVRKNYEYADIITYLPADTKENAAQFLRIVRPKLIVFIKYEFWFHFLDRAISQKIEVIYIAALFRADMLYFKSYFNIFLPVFSRINHFFVQNKASQDTLIEKVEGLDIDRITIAGDPRIDRVLEIAAVARSFPIIDLFSNRKKVLIAGSTWEKDLDVLKGFKDFQNWRLIIAPHELHEKNMLKIENQWGKAICLRYSQATEHNVQNARVLIIDNIGMLSSLYRYADIAYIGGGFGSGIHNTLEPMAFNIPVVFGPKYHQFEEACKMVEQKGAFSVESKETFTLLFNSLSDPVIYPKAVDAVRHYMLNSNGATEKIMHYCRIRLNHAQ